ncbi:MAG: hypothetical protein SFV15_04300 [Polyangiaceae bacterium]|nr:hypothetical protein [Polyangiaceae bacterium]
MKLTRSRALVSALPLLTLSLVALPSLSQTSGAPTAPAVSPSASTGAASPSASATAAPLPSAAPSASASAEKLPSAPSAPSAPAPAEAPKVVAPAVLAKKVPPPPPPSPAQLRAFQVLQGEAGAYEASAKEFRQTLTQIVRHHYEERRRRVLSALDAEITSEKKLLDSARDEAIARLEKFVAQYSGANAHVEATPDAMFRLAALYEERARLKSEGELSEALEPAVALYRRIVVEYPKYNELAAVHYYLGHALTDGARIEEGQQAWRALVCNNKFTVQDDTANASKVKLQPLAQDHDQAYWNEWYNQHPVPFDQAASGRKARFKAESDEVTYQDPYAGCESIPQQTESGEEPRYLAEIWWQLGNFHFDQIDPAGGPYNLNRAVSAYEHSMAYKKPPLYGVAMYKNAWAFFKQQRYHTAVNEFANLLRYADEQEEKTGDKGADFRSEAYTYIAGSLTYVDFEGPPADHPYIPRSDVLDTESNPVVAEEKMGIAIQRVQDASLIPQDKKWTVEIYKALAQEFIEITQNRNAISTLELTLRKFPMDRDAPVMQNKVAELYDQLGRLAPDGSAARAEYAQKALSARTALAAYVGATPWTNANRDDPEALQQAEELVKGGLRRAAADHTNFARTYYNKAVELSDVGEQRQLIEKAIAEYRLAESGWAAYLAQDPNASDAYESQFWLADARYSIVVLQVALERSPTEQEVADARQSAVAVRDSNEDDKYLQPAAYYVVSLADKVLDDEARKHEQGGKQGIERRTEVRFEGEGEARRVVRDVIPQPVVNAMSARDEYNARIAPDQDPEKNGMLYAFQVADWYFAYGQFDKARERFVPLYEQHCGKDEWGYKAWEKLISMSNFENNAAESRRLAEGKSCAFNEETKVAEESIRKPVKQGVAYLDARKLYEEAEKMPEGPARDKKWREAAAAYKVALDAAPDRDEAPEAAMNGAFAYKQVGEYDKAIGMYELFIARYGNNKTLTSLRDGDPNGKPPVSADPKKYQDRVGYLKNAYDALAGAYVLFFNYPKAAGTFDKISDISHFSRDARRESARQALSLYSSLGDTGGMRKSRENFRSLGASEKELAEADFTIASAELKQWDPLSPADGTNNTARRRAMTAMEAYYTLNASRPAAAQFVVQAAYWSAKARHSGKADDTNKWWQKTIEAFEKWKPTAEVKGGQSVALGSKEAGMAAEAEFTMLDEQIGVNFDYETGHHRYKGTPVEVIASYQKDALDAKKYYDKLQRVIDNYVSPEWTVAAISRQGSLYDSLRTGLYNTRPPALQMFDKKQEAMLKRAEESDNPDLQEKADAVRVKVQQSWRDRRDQELDGADQIMVDRYGNTVVLARRYNVSSVAVTRAIRRLAFFTDIIGEAKMKQHSGNVKDLNYTDGMFPKMRPGQVTAPAPKGMPEPLPVYVQ